MQQILETDREGTLMWKPHANLMFATIIYNVTGAHLALSTIILLMVDHTHARIILHIWAQVFLLRKRGVLFTSAMFCFSWERTGKQELEWFPRR